MQIQNKKIGNKGLFYAELDGEKLAEMVYTLPTPDKMIIEHTEVDEKLKGKNAGGQLLQAAVAYARTHNIKIIPLCPFASTMFKRKPENADVLLNKLT
jgi:predicted GNAT family acetyltransferase